MPPQQFRQYKPTDNSLKTKRHCKHCRNLYKPQGIKKHENSCAKELANQKAQEKHNKAYLRDIWQVNVAKEAAAASAAALLTSAAVLPELQAGPSRLPTSTPGTTFTLGADHGADSEPASMTDPPDNPDVSMASEHFDLPRASPDPNPSDFKTEFHPHSKHQTLYQSAEEFGQQDVESMDPDPMSLCPFASEGDFTFTKVAMEAGLLSGQVDHLLGLINSVLKGMAKFSKLNVTVPYKGEDVMFPPHVRPLWEWALDMLTNPLLAPHFVWDAQHLFKHDGQEYKRFYMEPWTVPLEKLWDLSKTFPMCTTQQHKDALVVYEDKKSAGEKKLNSLGLQPVHNVFWSVERSDPQETASFEPLHFLHGGMWGKHMLGDLKIILAELGREFETHLEEQVCAFPHWRGLAHFDTMIHITYSDGNKMRDLAKQCFYAGLNILTATSTRAGYQLLCMICSYLQLDSLTGLDVHTENTLAMIKSKLLVFRDELKAYRSCMCRLADTDLKLNWNFPKAHLWKHVTCDIHSKGVARNYSARPNEKMHGPLKDAYQDRSNGKDVAGQILRIDHHRLAIKLL
ncbi:hypothetical protein PAXRUDRAFT_14345 [Paxillus rubicundulus Ve08.2h10]|uniref:Uncharacterized protein n=1 Tax=Paxillus rubicundulus Ve08.2h10 TaxID=930991 RepID=A0A0D0DRN0_9AGAM|nr:hypothetical protein PAXRUDRAFT_14345 [Paxillus rubicundulus Ve08.2h10]